MGARRWLKGRHKALLACLAIHAQAAVAQAPSDIALQPAMIAVSVNGQALAEPLLLLRGPSGEFYASEETVRGWRLVPREAAGDIVIDGRRWLKLDSSSGINTNFSEESQSLEVRADPSAFLEQRLHSSADMLVPMTAPGTGAFANYDAFLEHTGGELTGAGSLELVGFTSKGVGAASFIGRTAGAGPNVIRLETNWTIDRPQQMMSIRIGDSIARGGSSMTPVRFGGIQIARNFDVQPGFITFPLPTVTGSAALPSVAEVYVDSVLRDSRAVDPGPFTLIETPVRAGGGTVQLVTRDLLGRQFVTSQSYYTSLASLRRGLHDFSYEAGFLREDFGSNSTSYSRFLVSALHRYGLTNAVTIEANARVTVDSAAGAAGLTATIFDLAQFTGSAAVSRSDRGVGTAVTAGLERRARGLSLGVRTEIRSANYFQEGELEERRTRLIAQAFADLETRWGSFGVNYFRRDERGRPGERLIGVNANVRTGSNTSLQLYARRAVSGEKQTTVGAFLAISLGPRQSASANVEAQDGRLTGRYALQQDLPSTTGNGFRTAVELGPTKSVNLQYLHNGPWGRYSAEFARNGSNNGVRMSAAGSVGLLEGSIFAARRLGSSFGEIRVGREAGVRVYADNNLVGVTGKDGKLIIPDLRAYERNTIRIDDADLPMTAHLDSYESVVRPFGRTGTVIDFKLTEERGTLLRLIRESGEPLPAGAEVRLKGQDASFTVAGGGELYVTGVEGQHQLTASWSGGHCQLRIDVESSSDPQPSLGSLVCRTERHAAR